VSRTIEFLDEKILERLIDLDLVNPDRLKQYKIRKEFWGELRKEMGSYAAIDYLAEKYCLSSERIRGIVYDPKHRQERKVKI